DSTDRYSSKRVAGILPIERPPLTVSELALVASNTMSFGRIRWPPKAAAFAWKMNRRLLSIRSSPVVYVAGGLHATARACDRQAADRPQIDEPAPPVKTDS